MQERYLGDVHDFMKFAFLRHMHRRLGVSLGVNWYLTQPTKVDGANNNDGNMRYHLAGELWGKIDRELVDCLRQFTEPKARQLAAFGASAILPQDTVYFNDEVAGHNRAVWHADALKKMAPADLIFLDPDNGFVVPSASKRRLPKYAYYNEVLSYLEAGKIATCIQFARQCCPVKKARSIRDELAALGFGEAILPTMRCRVSPNILFVTLAPSDHHRALRAALSAFSNMEPSRLQAIS